MVWTLLIGCGLIPVPPLEVVDQGCACLEPGEPGKGATVKVHLACVDCVDPGAIDFRCTVATTEDHVTVTASATIQVGVCGTSDSCSPLVGECEAHPDLPKGGYLLSYGGAEIPFSTPLPPKPICACPGSMPGR